jgi:exonuclease VII small subunit
VDPNQGILIKITYRQNLAKSHGTVSQVEKDAVPLEASHYDRAEQREFQSQPTLLDTQKSLDKLHLHQAKEGEENPADKNQPDADTRTMEENWDSFSSNEGGLDSGKVSEIGKHSRCLA